MSNRSVSEFMGCHHREGRVFGIEIELEGVGLPQKEIELEYDPEDEYAEPVEIDRTPDMFMWDIHEEGSIKGAEYVFKRPLPLLEAVSAVNWLYDTLRSEWKAGIYESPRTSVHVHVNASDWPIEKLKKALPLLAAAEPFLVEISGRHRKGNLFCLSRLDAPFGWAPIINILSGNSQWHGDTHYSGINFSPLFNKGSIEFRMMRGLTQAHDVNVWLLTIDTLMDAIDSLSEDYSYEEFPSVLSFLASNVPPEKIKKLERAGLRSARGVLEDMTLAAIMPPPMPPYGAMSPPQVQTISLSNSTYDIPPMPNYFSNVTVSESPLNASLNMTDEEILAALTAITPTAPSF